MGKTAGVRKKSMGPTASPMASFFAAAGTQQDSAVADCTEDKIAGTAQEVGGESVEPISHSEWQSELAGGFQRIETTLLEKIVLLIAPLTA